MAIRRTKSKAQVFLVLLILACGSSGAQVRPITVTWQPSRLANGSPVLFRLTAPANVESISAEWLEHTFSFFREGHSGRWYALAGVSLKTPAGVYTLKLSEKFADGHSTAIEKQIKVYAATYKKIPIRVARQFTEPNPGQVATIAADKGIKERTFAAVSERRLWSGPFVPPVSEPVSDLFGTERVINGKVQSRHQGLDYAAPAGTPVRAINRGVVLLARPMFFEGNFIVIDHGQGLLSLYLHLSEFKVKEGDQVSGGQVIALSGGTGRATGAHLHLSVRWQGIYLDPAILLRLMIPQAKNDQSVPNS